MNRFISRPEAARRVEREAGSVIQASGKTANGREVLVPKGVWPPRQYIVADGTTVLTVEV